MNPTDDPQAPMEMPTGNEPDDFKSMLIGASLIFVVSFIPFVSLLSMCCIPQILGILLAIHLFTKQYGLTLSFGKGIKLGILTALLGGFSSWLVAMGLLMTTGYQVGHEIQDLMIKYFDSAGPQFKQAADAMRTAIEQQKANGVDFKIIATGAGFTLVFMCIAGLIGGSLGTAIFKRGPRPE